MIYLIIISAAIIAIAIIASYYKSQIKMLINGVEAKAEKFKENIESIKLGDAIKIFVPLLIIGGGIFFILYSSEEKGFAVNAEAIILGSALCFIDALIDVVLLKGIKTVEILKQNPIAFVVYSLRYPMYFYIASQIVK